jgi:triacylglycerol esterase/lipase EstA (alpha/beta hydrolase family)
VVPVTALRLLAAALVTVSVAGCSHAAKPKAAPPATVPVFLVPGYGGDADSVPALVSALRDAGRDVRVVVPPDGGRAPIADGAAELDRAVRASGAARVDLVGYSMGGLVVRDWVAERGGAALARTVVTIGAPHHGSAALVSLPAADCTGACVDMKPGSALLARLNAGDETPDGPRWVSVWSRTDTNVTPPDTARLAGATNVRVQDACPEVRLSHEELVGDPSVLAYVAATLAAGNARLACAS